ncbi:uncharacterized protein [Panulirus ornatus]
MPEYVARWVPTTPAAYTQQSLPKFSGFGAPKDNSIVESHSSPASSMVPPPVASAATPIAAPPPTGYAPPHPDDIITKAVGTGGGHLPTAPAPAAYPPQFVTIPETAIRSAVNAAPVTIQEPIFSALVQDEAAVKINDFRPLDPSNVISIEDNNSLDVLETTYDDTVDNAINDGTLTVLQPAPSETLLVLDGEISGVPKEADAQPTSSPTDTDEPLFIVEPEDNAPQATLTPQTTTLVHDDEILRPLQDDNSGKVFVSPVASLQPKDIGPENVTDDIKLETVSSTRVHNQGPQVSDGSEPSHDFQPSPVFDEEDSQFSEGFQPNPQFISSVNIQPNPRFVLDETVVTSPEFASSENFESDPEFISIEDFLRSPGFVSDESALLDVAVSQDIKFDDDYESSRDIQTLPEGLQQLARSRSSPQLRPTLVAPPASPPLLDKGRAMFSHGVLPLENAIPQPLPIPVGPVASITLDFPQEGPVGYRQSRVLTGAASTFSDLRREALTVLPFGARLRPRPIRRHYSRAAFLG